MKETSCEFRSQGSVKFCETRKFTLEKVVHEIKLTSKAYIGINVMKNFTAVLDVF